ncbi:MULTISPECIES: helix-turn-helix domain-containing protein [Streptomyces]|uniref:helix-turn-helix domain-containing protein n=1 Tax=Streptomyces TaxID=1883 RepID=UPI002DD7C0EC|nr:MULTISPECIES: helix-turn-helix domain-containing protein [unclassified Streptomyces]
MTTQAEPAEAGTGAWPSDRAAQGGFGDALREWRVRRRVSQLELATRAGTTQRHVSFVESGRSVPGRAMVVRLAEALKVPLRERNALLLAAGYAPAYQESHFGGPQLSAVRTALERVMEAHLPYPAVIIDRRGDLVARNEAFDALTEGVANCWVRGVLYRAGRSVSGWSVRWERRILCRMRDLDRVGLVGQVD